MTLVMTRRNVAINGNMHEKFGSIRYSYFSYDSLLHSIFFVFMNRNQQTSQTISVEFQNMKLVSVVLFFMCSAVAFAQTNTGAWDDTCTVDSNCLSPYKCIAGSCAWGPNWKGLPCISNSDCTNGYCDPSQNVCEDCVDDAGCGDGNHCAVGQSVSFCFTGGKYYFL